MKVEVTQARLETGKLLEAAELLEAEAEAKSDEKVGVSSPAVCGPPTKDNYTAANSHRSGCCLLACSLVVCLHRSDWV